MSTMSYDALSLFQNLRAGDKIDVQDQEGDWFETIVREVIGNKIICHFWGFANIWDCTIEYNPSKIAPVHTYSERSKYKDNEKLLGECVWEILSLKNMLNNNKQCTNDSFAQIHSQTGILQQNMQSFLDTMEASDDTQLKLCKYVQKNVIEMGLNVRIQELMENGPDCFGYDDEIRNNIKTIENMDNIKQKISQSIHEIEQKKQMASVTQEIKPLNLANLSKIDLPEISDIAPLNNKQQQQQQTQQQMIDSSTTNTDNNSSDSHYIDHSNINPHSNTNIIDTKSALFIMQQNHPSQSNSHSESDTMTSNSRSQSHKSKNSNSNSRKRKLSIASKKPKKRHKKNSETAAMIPTMIDHSNGINKVLVTKYDHNAIKKEWLDIPRKDELIAGPDGKYRCQSDECSNKPAFKTYTSTCRHIQIEHQGYRYRCDLCRDEYETEVEFRSHSTLKIHLANMHKLTKSDFSKIRIILSLAGNDSIVKKTASCDQHSFKKWKKQMVVNDNQRNKMKKINHEHSRKLNQNNILNTANINMNMNQNMNQIMNGGNNMNSNLNSIHALNTLPVFGLVHNDNGNGSGLRKKEESMSSIVSSISNSNNCVVQVSERQLRSNHPNNNVNNNIINVNNRNGMNMKALDMKMKMKKISNLNLGLNLDLNLTATAPAPEPMKNKKKNRKDKVFMDRIDELIQNLETDPKTKKKNKKKDRKPICPVCGQKFKNFQALGGHKKKHNPNWGRNRKKQVSSDDCDNENDEDFDVEMVRKNKKKKHRKKQKTRVRNRITRNHSKSKKKQKKDVKMKMKEKEKEIKDINFSTMPQIQIKMPPPPPPKLENDSNDSNQSSDDDNDNVYVGGQSIYTRQEKHDNIYKNIKQYPFGPLWIPGANNNIFIADTNTNNSNNNRNNMEDEQQMQDEWIHTTKMSVSNKFGSLFLHFDEI